MLTVSKNNMIVILLCMWVLSCDLAKLGFTENKVLSLSEIAAKYLKDHGYKTVERLDDSLFLNAFSMRRLPPDTALKQFDSLFVEAFIDNGALDSTGQFIESEYSACLKILLCYALLLDSHKAKFFTFRASVSTKRTYLIVVVVDSVDRRVIGQSTMYSGLGKSQSRSYVNNYVRKGMDLYLEER